MVELRFSLCAKLSIVLALFSFLFMGCVDSTAIYISNNCSDNFRIGDSNGKHVKPGESIFLTTLTKENDSYSVELWRSYGCIAVLNIYGIIEKDKIISAFVSIYDSVLPPFACTSDNNNVHCTTVSCPD